MQISSYGLNGSDGIKVNVILLENYHNAVIYHQILLYEYAEAAESKRANILFEFGLGYP